LKRMQEHHQNLPIEQHKDYRKLRDSLNQLLKNKLLQTKAHFASLPIEQHKDYSSLMDTYACRVGIGPESKHYVPCPSCDQVQQSSQYVSRGEAKQSCQK